MSNNKEVPTPLLIEDLGMLYATNKSIKKCHFGVFKCICGAKFKSLISHVKNGNTKSCGCYQKKRVKEISTTHGLSNHPILSVWKNMIQRTTNQNNKNYKDYGARGILICKEWKNDFKVFFDWCILNGYKKGLEIDRIDNNIGYDPSNCRFTTRSVQTRNTRILRADNISGYRGVNWHKQNKSWRAQISINKKLKYLGRFDTAIEAAKAYDIYVIEHNLEHTINGVL